MSTVQNITNLALDLKDQFKNEGLTMYQALDIACKMTQIETIESAFMITSDGNLNYPSALESIGMALGVTNEYGRARVKIDGIAENIEAIAGNIDRLATAIEDK